MDIFLNQLVLFYSNNATNLHHLTTHSTTALTYKMAIVHLTQCGMIHPTVWHNTPQSHRQDRQTGQSE